MDDFLVGERLAERRGLDGVDVADQVGDRDVGRRELSPGSRSSARIHSSGSIVRRVAAAIRRPYAGERIEGRLV